jgi:MFS family permease
MNNLFGTAIILLFIIFIFLILATYTQDYSNKNKNNAFSQAVSRWFTSICGGATFALIIGIILYFFPRFQIWHKFQNV